MIKYKIGTVEKQVYSGDLKSPVARHGGSTPPGPTKQMTDKVQEILDILQEECAEVIQNISKCRRFGMENVYLKGEGTQRDQLVKELGDVLAMIELLIENTNITTEELELAKRNKFVKLHHWSNIFK